MKFRCRNFPVQQTTEAQPVMVDSIHTVGSYFCGYFNKIQLVTLYPL